MSDSKCNETRDVFQTGRVPSDPDTAGHVITCERCRALLANGGRLGLSLGELGRANHSELGALKAAVLRNARGEVGLRAWLRGRSRRQRLVLVMALVLLFVGLSAFRNERLDPRDTQPLLLWAPVILYLGGIMLGLLELVADPARMVQGARRNRLAFVLGILPALTVLWTEYALVHQTDAPDANAKPAIACFIFGSLFTVALLVFLWLLDRSDRVSRAAAPLAATMAGVFGTLAVHLHCAVAEPVHLLLGHLALLPAWLLVLVTATRWRWIAGPRTIRGGQR